MSTKVGILIPCRNVAEEIGPVLQSFSPAVLERVARIVVVENHSDDGTLGALEKMKKSGLPMARKLVIIRNHANYGLGGSQKIAYRFFLERGFTHFFIVHGDGQGNGERIARNFFAEWDLFPDVDLIAASRFMRESDVREYSGLRRFVNRGFNAITAMLTGIRMSDAGCGIIFLRTDLLRSLPFWGLTSSAQFNPQLNLLFYGSRELRIREVPLAWRDSRARSNLEPILYCARLLKILVRYRIAGLMGRSRTDRFGKGENRDFAPKYDILYDQ